MIKQTNSVQAKHAPLLSLFLNGYENMRQKMDAPCRRPLLEIAPLVFGKWYYAALAKETILSPANLFALDLQKDSDAKIEYAYIMNTKAAEEQSDLEFTSEYHFSLMTYSTQKHPLVADLQALIGYCTPDRATDENGMLLEEEKKEILAIICAVVMIVSIPLSILLHFQIIHYVFLLVLYKTAARCGVFQNNMMQFSAAL